MRLAIVGGGITGLATAWHARRLAAQAGRELDVIVLEAGARAGGKALTVREGGWVIEAAPDSFLTSKPWAHDLAIALGLGDRLIAQRAGGRRAFVLHRGRL
ncbi:MAG: FAD-dependent oxidoreductase [Anaerolineae bacterium]